MRLITPLESRSLDAFALEHWHVPGLLLMENAARMLALKAFAMDQSNPGIVLILAGPGNNGGDALATARHLLNMGKSVRVITAAPENGYKGDAAMNADMLTRIGVHLLPLADFIRHNTLNDAFAGVSLVIDGLYGTGLSRNITGDVLDLINRVNTGKHLVLSIDIPSGVHGLTGQILGSAIVADATVTLGMPKPGLYQYPGAACSGEISVADLGIPLSLALQEPTVTLLDIHFIKSILRWRAPDLHKGTAGRVLMLAGSERMCGAAVLCAASAYRTGAGYVNMVVPKSISAAVTIQLPEAVLSFRREEWLEEDIHHIVELMSRAGSVAIGPGMGLEGTAVTFMKTLLQQMKKPLVCDADALRILASAPELLSFLPPRTVITPHPAEMAALCGLDTADVQKDRLHIAKSFAESYQVIVVLKGAGTVIADPNGQTYINPTGNNGMATAGSGDVLTGMIAAFLAAGADPLAAALCGCYIHGLAGDLSAKDGTTGLMASDIVNSIRVAQQMVENGGTPS